MDNKVCLICGETKALPDFHKNHAKCKSCYNEIRRQQRETYKYNINEYKRALYSARKEHHQKLARECYRRRREKALTQKKEYFQLNKKEIAAKKCVYRKHRYATDAEFKISLVYRARIRNAFKGKNKSKSTLTLLGCSVKEAKLYLEQKFKPGMTWENHGDWHIDHIIPLSSAKNTEELEKLCHYTNLQPLWAIENMQKGAKYVSSMANP